ncbi:MAG: hypothetical protein JWO95_3417 [Verrucomicrobiales bacterium]|nr:hypothetical protein [Verrucomicrobiales bacterium]
MSGVVPFSPELPSVILASGTSSTSIALGNKAGTSESVPTPQGYPTFPGGFSVQVVNSGTATVQIAFGSGAATATSASGVMVLGNTTRVFGVNPNITHLAQIASASGNNIYATAGQGGT